MDRRFQCTWEIRQWRYMKRRSPNLSSFLPGKDGTTNHGEPWTRNMSKCTSKHDHHTAIRVKKRHFTPDRATPRRLNPICQPNPEHHVKKEKSPTHALEMVWNKPPFLPRHVTRYVLHFSPRHVAAPTRGEWPSLFLQIPRQWHTWRMCWK